jgi:hypothetical protein
MNRYFKGLVYLLALNFELAFLMVGGVYAGRYLNGLKIWHHDWINITAPISLVLCCLVLYRFLVFIIKNSRKKAPDVYKIDTKSNLDSDEK